MQPVSTTTTAGWFAVLRGLSTVLVATLLVFATGCDSGNNGGGDGSDDGTVTTASYDTTFAGDGSPEIVTVSDQGGGILPDTDDNTVTWSNDIVYRLDGFVFVDDGETLDIEPGTEIRGETGQQEQASALIVSRGGKIDAEGTSSNPIVFTSVQAATSDLGRSDRGLWGGIILLGDAPLNSGDESTIEGVPDQEGDRILYGGDDPNHDIGTLKYVSIRHTGSQLASGDEIQGLTLGGIGNGSTIEYVESYASDDDGFEWFGGTVNTKYLIAAFASDDAFDIDEGYRGSNQFWLAVQGGNEAGRIGEHDGGTDPEDGTPYATSIISNATYIGMGPGLSDGSVAGDANDPFLMQRDNNATSYHNTVFTGGRTDAGLQIEDLDGDEDAANRWDDPSTNEVGDGPLNHENNLWHNIGPSFDSETSFGDLIQLTGDGDRGTNMRDNLASYLSNNGNEIVTSSPLQNIDRTNGDGAINDFNPDPAGAATSGADLPNSDAFWTDVSERGAFASNANWNLNGWTKIVAEGELVGQ